jgi:Protein of unknown function (DUF2934)
MSQPDPPSIWCRLSPELTVERRIATALWNEHERDRIIAMKAYEAFCLRGCEHGSDLDDWLSAERELMSEADDVVITESKGGFDISIAEHPQKERIFLSIAPSSLLILWTGGDTNSSGEIQCSTLNLTSLPEAADATRAEVTYRDERVWLRLPHVGGAHSPSEPGIPDTSGPGDANPGD